ncbi:hypothetical protein CEXT_165301 [Caerostris extrusa]|uniref:Uncharacterized protein n=1 Tax=Caerostris extrusa TaxID=172846 RepID=A0AAV4T865_CAEEX|nr:hypothetical protein CEXT_165301 [Caerostris extrusa]
MRDNAIGQSEASPGQPRFESADFQEVPRESRFNLRKAMEDWDFLKVDDRDFYLIFYLFFNIFLEEFYSDFVDRILIASFGRCQHASFLGTTV